MRVLPTTVVTRGRKNPAYLKLPTRLKRERKRCQLSTAQLSRTIKAGLNTVTQIEAGERIPRLPMLERLSDALRVSPGALAYGLPGVWEPAEGLRCKGLAARIRQLRDESGLSLSELGRRTGTSAAAVSLLEKGSQPTLDTLEQLATALGVSPAWLAFSEGDRAPVDLPRRGARPAAEKPPGGENSAVRPL